jgi:hypothetical protein
VQSTPSSYHPHHHFLNASQMPSIYIEIQVSLGQWHKLWRTSSRMKPHSPATHFEVIQSMKCRVGPPSCWPLFRTMNCVRFISLLTSRPLLIDWQDSRKDVMITVDLGKVEALISEGWALGGWVENKWLIVQVQEDRSQSWWECFVTYVRCWNDSLAWPMWWLLSRWYETYAKLESDRVYGLGWTLHQERQGKE